jgi:serine O-acetyltransferase
MDELIKGDLFRYFGRTDSKTFWQCLSMPGFRYTFFMRKVAKHKRNTILGVIFRLLLKRYIFKYGIQIPPETKIGKGFCIYHFGSIVINSKAVIGKNCTIASCITIGQANRGSRKGNPVIGDQVFIGSGAVVVGKIVIGNNVLIAPNAYVNFDVPSNSIVIGNPGKIISNENATEAYVVNTV